MKKFAALMLTLIMVLAMVPALAEEKVEITFWDFPNFTQEDGVAGSYEQKIIAAFNEKYPNITVNLEMLDFDAGPEKITTAILAGTTPDVIFDAPGRIITWAQAGALAPLDDMLSPEDIEDYGAFLAACKYDDKVYMYPQGSAPFLMAFNKTMLEKHGLLDMINLEGDRSWTLEQYETLLRALKEKGEMGAVIFARTQGGDQGTRAYLANLYGGSVLNEDMTEYTLNNDAGVKALDWVVNMCNEELLINGSAYDGTGAIDEFCSGRVSHTILWSPGLLKTRAAELEEMEIETVFVPFPSTAQTYHLEFLAAGMCVFDNGDPAKIEAAKKFVDFVCNDEVWGPANLESTGNFSPRASVKVESDNPEVLYAASTNANYGAYYNTVTGFAEMRTFWFPALQAALNGEVTAQQAMDDFVAKANETLIAK